MKSPGKSSVLDARLRESKHLLLLCVSTQRRMRWHSFFSFFRGECFPRLILHFHMHKAPDKNETKQKRRPPISVNVERNRMLLKKKKLQNSKAIRVRIVSAPSLPPLACTSAGLTHHFHTDVHIASMALFNVVFIFIFSCFTYYSSYLVLAEP